MSNKTGQFLLTLFISLVIFSSGTLNSARGNQSQYFYDDLGRLVGVADGFGNMAVYQYDAVGNLLSIQRFTSSSTGTGIFLLVPSSGVTGSEIEIWGYGFSPVASNNQVSFNGTAAVVISSTPSSIITTVPPNATTGPVTVTNANGTGISPNSFTVLQLPVITGINPYQVAQGSTTYNTMISGFNLTNATSVSFSNGGITASILSGGTSTFLPINLVVASTVPFGSYPFSVTTPVGVGQSGNVTVSVRSPSPASRTALPISVFMPAPPQVQPSGSESISANALSVYLPPLANQSPSGPESATTLPLSIYFPSSSIIAPSGSETAVAPPESVSMP